MCSRTIVTALAVLLAGSVLLAETNEVAKKDSKVELSPQKKEQRWLQKTGGLLAKPGSQKGQIVFLDVGNVARDSDYDSVIKKFEEDSLRFSYTVVRKDSLNDFTGPNKFLSVKKALNADVLVAVVSDPDLPTLFTAPFEWLAVVNVTKLAESLKTDAARQKFLSARVRKAMMRGLAGACGAGGSSFPGNIVAAVKIEDLDFCREFVPADALQRMIDNLREKGVTPVEYYTYRKACRQGWAPAPTNDFQKVIWDKVHELPSDPIKIEFDPKKDK